MRIPQVVRFVPLFVLAIMSGSCFAPIAIGQSDFLQQARQRIERHRQSDIKIEVQDASGRPVPSAKVRLRMTRHAFRWGTAAVAARINANDSDAKKYKQTLLENFNSIVFENDLKWSAWGGNWGDGVGWKPAERSLKWLQENDLSVRGHYISWATLSGDDGFGPGANKTDGLRQRLFKHIDEKVAAVGDRVSEWDVINHPIGWGPDTYEDIFGVEFFAEIIQHSRKILPRGVELWMNEDKILAGTDVADEYERVLNYLMKNDAVVDGIGFQGHFKSSWGRNDERSTENIYLQMERFSKIIPRLQITEFDIDVGEYDKDGKLISYDQNEHARLMKEYLISAFSHPKLEGITMWGFWEGSHWAPAAALYNKDWSPRPALTAYRDLVYDQWWTDQTGQTNAKGVFELRGFKGQYEIIVEHAGKTVSQSFNTKENAAKITLAP